jgi:hypothetical protein
MNIYNQGQYWAIKGIEAMLRSLIKKRQQTH